MFGQGPSDLDGVNAAKIKTAMKTFIKGFLQATYTPAEYDSK
jgi:hypothetical protein